jgi:hypothetical protein
MSQYSSLSLNDIRAIRLELQERYYRNAKFFSTHEPTKGQLKSMVQMSKTIEEMEAYEEELMCKDDERIAKLPNSYFHKRWIEIQENLALMMLEGKL